MRASIAIGICLAAVIGAVFGLFFRGVTPYFAASLVSSVWLFTGMWLGKTFWMFKMGHKDLYQATKEGRTQFLPLPKLMINGGIALSLISILCWLLR